MVDGEGGEGGWVGRVGLGPPPRAVCRMPRLALERHRRVAMGGCVRLKEAFFLARQAPVSPAGRGGLSNHEEGCGHVGPGHPPRTKYHGWHRGHTGLLRADAEADGVSDI